MIRFSFGRLPMTLLEGMILILFLVWLVQILYQVKIDLIKEKIRQYKYLFLFIFLFLTTASISVFVSPDIKSAAGVWKAYFIEPIMLLLVIVGVTQREDIKQIFKVLSVQALFLSVVAIYQKITGSFIFNEFWAGEATRRVTSIYAYPNALALYLTPVFLILIGWLAYLWFKEKSRVGYMFYYLTVVLLSFGAIYFTLSKGALVAILTGLVFYSLFYIPLRKYFIILTIIIILSGSYLATSGVINLTGKSSVVGGDSISVRLGMWQEGWWMLQDKSLWGAGLSGYQQSVLPYHQKDYIEIYLYPHNVVLNFWSEIGFLGLLSFVLIVVYFYYLAYQSKYDKYAIITMSAMLALLVHGLVDVPYFKNDLSVLFWLLVAIVLVIDKQRFESKLDSGV